MEAEEITAVLTRWRLSIQTVVPIAGGLNSAVWSVHTADDRRCVAKLADVGSAAAFRSGLRVARRASRRGFPSGPPVPLPDGSLSLAVPAGELALLDWLPGRTPDLSSEADLARAGAVLARAHSALAAATDCVDPELAWPWPWADDALSRIPMPAAVRSAAGRAIEAARHVTARAGLVVQVVHGDPAYDSFRLADDAIRVERDGMIDWAATMTAPALYDLGTVAALNTGHPDRLRAFTRGYLDVDPGRAAELPTVPTFARLRWMCVALYFADRIASGTVRGGSAAANRTGLAEAHCRLTPA